MLRRPPRSPLFPYPTLFRSIIRRHPRPRWKSSVQLGLAAGREIRGHGRITRQCGAAAPAGDALKHRERRHDEGMMRRHKTAKIRLWETVNEKVRQSIRTRFDCLAGALERADVNHSEFLACVGGGDHRSEEHTS